MGRNLTLKKINKNSNSVWVLILGVAAVTIYLSTKAYDPFNTPKLILTLFVSGWLFGHLVNSYRDNPINFKSMENVTLLVSIIFIVAYFVSTLFTDVLVVGFIGDTQRRNGFLAYFALVIIFLYASRSINFQFALRIIKVAIFTGLILGSYGLLQISGNDFFKWNNPYNSMISTLGNPNFASAMLAILSVIAIFSLFINKISKFYKLIAVIVIILSLFDIIKSQSRQGLLALFFAILFYISVYSYLNRRKIGILIMVVSSLMALLSIAGMLQKGPFASFLYKDSVSVRGYYWRAGIKMLMDKPFTGVGVDRYGAYFKEYREIAYPLKYGFDITSSNAHNTIIQLFSTAGIFVGLAYLFLLSYVLFIGIRSVKETVGNDQRIILTLLTAWIGFQSQSLISIDNIGVSVWGWLLGGAILGVSSKGKVGSVDIDYNKKTNNSKLVKINIFQPVISSLVLIPMLVISYFLYSAEINNVGVRTFAIPSAPQNANIVLNYAEKVINNPLADPNYKYVVSTYLYDMGFKKEAYNEINLLSNSDPRNLDYLKGLAIFGVENRDYISAISARLKIAKYDPWNAQNLLDLCKLYVTTGDLVKANEMKDQIISFAGSTEIAKTAREILG